ncbi:hypothetical protein dqs_0611 [Azoarcus olearius]|uniref:hypothetical protein n=1 Tax=Azoarcus sp. (strain BH72) TaxID=418699 RepID=UPI0008061043|nr:hypothetical protein [Azoarcus olearius]ANQ83687.1 hypothetical protein dqs_0611 [Azoarcus olearius]
MALHIHLEPVMYVGRGYVAPDGFAHKHAYEMVCSIFMLGDGRARVFAAHGDMDRGTVTSLAGQLEALGIHTVLVNRHGVEQEWQVASATCKARKTE